MKSFPESGPQHAGSTVWKNELGELHREDGPAYEWSNGDKSYYQHGLRHREDGPAFEGWIGPNGDIPLIEVMEMKVKPKDVSLNLPCHFEFQDEDECAQMAANINSVLHGRDRVKYDFMGTRGSNIVCLLYLERNREYQEYRDFIKRLVIDPDDEPITEECDHNWVIDGHNDGDTFCSKCFKDVLE